MNGFKNKNITVFGLGKSGIAAAKKLALLGAKVTVTEVKPVSGIDPSALKEIQELKVDLEIGGHSSKSIRSADLIIVSPGVHLDIPVLEEAKAKGIPVISEIELAYQILTKPIIAVTGTNGKTTTTALVGEMIKAAGKKVAVAGNIGYPLTSVDDHQLDFIVAEVSSYQLETIQNFRPWVSLILNIQEDHLERHHSISEYIAQKARIFKNQTGDDYVIYNQDDPFVVEMVKGVKAKLIGFSKNHPETITLAPSEIKIPGEHNLENALAAAQVAYVCGIDKKTVEDVLRTFPGVEHRIEFVARIDGIEFYNDSKATNPDSTRVALETFRGRGMVLILGGRDKGVSLDSLGRKVKGLVKNVVLMGEAAARFEKAFREIGFDAIYHAQSLADAVKKSFSLAKEDEIVLLSPACASFDRFANFEERGRVFKQEVQKLCEKQR